MADASIPQVNPTAGKSDTLVFYQVALVVTLVLLASVITFFAVRTQLFSDTAGATPIPTLHPTAPPLPTTPPQPTSTPRPTLTQAPIPAEYGCSTDGSGSEGCQAIGEKALKNAGCPSFTTYNCNHLCITHPEYRYPGCGKK